MRRLVVSGDMAFLPFASSRNSYFWCFWYRNNAKISPKTPRWHAYLLKCAWNINYFHATRLHRHDDSRPAKFSLPWWRLIKSALLWWNIDENHAHLDCRGYRAKACDINVSFLCQADFWNISLHIWRRISRTLTDNISLCRGRLATHYINITFIRSFTSPYTDQGYSDCFSLFTFYASVEGMTQSIAAIIIATEIDIAYSAFALVCNLELYTSDDYRFWLALVAEWW